MNNDNYHKLKQREALFLQRDINTLIRRIFKLLIHHNVSESGFKGHRVSHVCVYAVKINAAINKIHTSVPL